MISACCIAKNEEKNLPRWCKCARALADELIVVDTGSDDYTVAIATAAKATVFHFDWCDDFSAAKNYAISKAHGDWIAFLDADEYFLPKDISKVKEYIQQADDDIAGIICPWINIDNDKTFISEGIQLRLFRNNSNIRYYGRIHEILGTSGDWSVGRVYDVNIYHTGYSINVARSKFERNLRILLNEQKRRGETWTDYYYLMDCYYGLNMYNEAIEQAEKAIASGKTLIGFEGRPEAIIESSKALIQDGAAATQN